MEGGKNGKRCNARKKALHQLVNQSFFSDHKHKEPRTRAKDAKEQIGLRLLPKMLGGGLSLQVGLARRWSKLRQNRLIPASECTITGSEIGGGGYIYIYIYIYPCQLSTL